MWEQREGSCVRSRDCPSWQWLGVEGPTTPSAAAKAVRALHTAFGGAASSLMSSL